MNDKITKEKFNELIDKVAAVGPPSPPVMIIPLHILEDVPQFFYTDNQGVLWFETPWTVRAPAKIIPNIFSENGNILVNKKILEGIYNNFEKCKV